MAFNPIDSYQRWWLRQRPEQKRNIKVIAALVALISSVSVGDYLYKGNQPNIDAELKADEDTSTTTLLPQVGNLSLQETQDQVQELNDTVQKLQDQITSTDQQNQAGFTQINSVLGQIQKDHELAGEAAANGVSTADQQEIDDLKNQLSQMQTELAAGASSSPSDGGPPAAPAETEAPDIQISSASSNDSSISGQIGPPPAPGGSAAPPTPPSQVMTVSTSTQGVNLNVDGTQSTVFVPAGSILTGVLLNGIDVSTADDAQDDPQAALVRLKKETLLPNRFRMDLVDCHVLVSGYGDLTDARALLRANLLSCVTPNGGVITVPIEAYVVGPDGLNGVPGTVISHQGELLSKSLIAGLLGGFAANSQATQEPVLNISPSGQTQYQAPNIPSVAQNSVLAGAGQGAENVSQFYLKQAEALAPVVQVNPGVAVNLVLIKGVHLDLSGSTHGNLDANSSQDVSPDADSAASDQDDSQDQDQGQEASN